MRKLVFSITIKDCDVETFTVGGAGGAGKDTSNTGVRIRHHPSGSVGVCVDTRSQRKNKEMAFRRMAETDSFQRWAKLLAAEISGQRRLEDIVDELMQPKNIKIEVRTKDGWEIIK